MIELIMQKPWAFYALINLLMLGPMYRTMIERENKYPKWTGLISTVSLVLAGLPILLIAGTCKVIADWFFVIKATKEGKSI